MADSIGREFELIKRIRSSLKSLIGINSHFIPTFVKGYIMVNLYSSFDFRKKSYNCVCSVMYRMTGRGPRTSAGI